MILIENFLVINLFYIIHIIITLTLFRMGLFGASHSWGAKRPPSLLSHISYNDENWQVIPYVKKTQEICESRDTPFDFC